jgi:hypothetical protein
MRIAKCGLRNLGWRFRDSHAVRSKGKAGKAGKADCEMRTAEFSEDGSGILTLLDLRERRERRIAKCGLRNFRRTVPGFSRC